MVLCLYRGVHMRLLVTVEMWEVVVYQYLLGKTERVSSLGYQHILDVILMKACSVKWPDLR